MARFRVSSPAVEGSVVAAYCTARSLFYMATRQEKFKITRKCHVVLVCRLFEKALAEPDTLGSLQLLFAKGIAARAALGPRTLTTAMTALKITDSGLSQVVIVSSPVFT